MNTPDTFHHSYSDTDQTAASQHTFQRHIELSPAYLNINHSWLRCKSTSAQWGVYIVLAVRGQEHVVRANSIFLPLDCQAVSGKTAEESMVKPGDAAARAGCDEGGAEAAGGNGGSVRGDGTKQRLQPISANAGALRLLEGGGRRLQGAAQITAGAAPHAAAAHTTMCTPSVRKKIACDVAKAFSAYTTMPALGLLSIILACACRCSRSPLRARSLTPSSGNLGRGKVWLCNHLYRQTAGDVGWWMPGCADSMV